MGIVKEYTQAKEESIKNFNIRFRDRFLHNIANLIVNIGDDYIDFPFAIRIGDWDSTDHINGINNAREIIVYHDESCSTNDVFKTTTGITGLSLDDLALIQGTLQALYNTMPAPAECPADVEPVWIDPDHIMGERRYHREEALQVIRETLKADKEYRDGRKTKSYSEDELFEIAYNHYNIYLED